MTIRSWVLLCLLCYGNFCWAQDTVVDWSESVQKSVDQALESITFTPDSGYVIIRKERQETSKYNMTFTDSNLVVLFDKEYDFGSNKVISIERVGQYVMVFSSIHNEEDELHVHLIDNKGEVVKTTMLFDSPSNGGYSARYQVSVSPDANYVGVVCERAHEENKNEFIDVLLYNKNMELVKHTEHGYALPSLKRKVNVPLVNNDGVIYIGKRIRLSRQNKYFLTVVNGGVGKDYELKLRSRKIADLNFDLTDDGNLIIAGFYSSPAWFNFEGAFAKKYEPLGTEIFSKEFMLPENAVNTFKSNKEISKTGFGVNQFHVRKVLVNANGSAYLVAEHHEIVKDKEETVDQRDGVLIIKFSKTGDFLWAAPIATSQTDGSDRGYWSSVMLQANEKHLNVLYNLIGEVDKKIANEFEDVSDYPVVLNKIDENGKVTELPTVQLLKSLGNKINVRTQCYNNLGDFLLFVGESEDRSTYHVGKVNMIKP